jgi:magnesium chelatase family protein
LFLDELPEFPRNVLETLRQPLETGEVMIARANAHVKYPCRFTLIAAANPCRCGYMTQPDQACNRAPLCGAEYLSRISGPLMDRFDLRIEVPPVSFRDLSDHNRGEASETIAARVHEARLLQLERTKDQSNERTNADLQGEKLTPVMKFDGAAVGYL